MENEQMSDLAKAIRAGERITPATGIIQTSAAPTNGTSVPKGALPITEGARMVCDSADKLPKGAVRVNFSEEEKDK